ncbi:hypothetical protein, partial [Thauera sp.]|uniref:hypothetical protein n=1 Tax=Thauera sp. TaxID=1905334 RepID=UPI002CDDA3DF
MPMVDVRKVRVLVDQRLVAVPMFMWIVTVPGEVVFVLVVFVMDVPMAMLPGVRHFTPIFAPFWKVLP